MLNHKFIIALLLALAIFQMPLFAQVEEELNPEDLIITTAEGQDVLVIRVIEGKEEAAADSILNHLSQPENKNELIDFLRTMFIKPMNSGCERPIPFLFDENYRDPQNNRYFGIALKDGEGNLYMPNTTRVGYFRLQRTVPNPATDYLPRIGAENQYFFLEEHASCYHLFAFSVICDINNTQSEGSIIIVEKAILKEQEDSID